MVGVSKGVKNWLARGILIVAFSFLLSYFISSEAGLNFSVVLGVVLSAVSILVAIYFNRKKNNDLAQNTQQATNDGNAIHVHGDNNTIVTHRDALSDEQVRDLIEADDQEQNEGEG